MVTLLDRLASLVSASTRRTTTLYVDGGSVACPQQGDVSVELCLACAHLREVDGDPVRWIECRPGLDSMSEATSQLAL